jgi:DNA-directed RNA polymerase sigma subunit (sigma70/sigma32)
MSETKSKPIKADLTKTEHMPEDIILFKTICQDLFDANQIGATYDDVVNFVLRTPYGDICRGGELTLNEIGFIFDVTRERIRQKELDARKILSRSLGVKELNDYLSITGEDRITKKRLIHKIEEKMRKKVLCKK